MPRTVPVLLATVFTFCPWVSSAYAEANLGVVDFPTSGSEVAQSHFLHGVAALHSFWYDEALAEFRAATSAEPNFAMGYWGEAMTYNHPLWAVAPEVDSARQALAKIKDNATTKPKEAAFIAAVKVLYGDGDKASRDLHYSEAMSKMHRAYPDDLEVSTFYALSLLGTANPGMPGELGRRMQAAAIALPIFKDHPNHPGAAHYIIHAFDDPEHAILALPAARQYAAIAPAAFHALHMPSHIFLQLGMWNDVTASNEASWQASKQEDFHSLQWLEYSYLQQGRVGNARNTLALSNGKTAQAHMAATFIVETEAWAEAAKLLANALPEKSKTEAKAQSGGAHPPGCLIPQDMSETQVLFVRGLATAHLRAPEFAANLATLRLRARDFAGTDRQKRTLEIQTLELVAADAAVKGKFDAATEAMRRATKLEAEATAPSGPPDVIKPANELFGEILLTARQPAEAEQQFMMALARHSNRARSLLGAARAAAAQDGGRERARSFYATLVSQWQLADAKSTELSEATAWLAARGS